MTTLAVKRNDMAFCPGCSHGMVLEHLSSAFDRMGLAPTDVCIVSDIGCVGISDRYLDCHTFHGLHGRSITYAEGIKRAKPDTTVVVLIGDGGCGIGTAHLVHAARRGADINVVVCNNFNFGMTGGQHSATTPQCALTTTTPDGSTDYPFDICQTAAVSGASYVGRFTAFDADMPAHLEKAIRTRGFALIDVWELCVAYYTERNHLNRKTLTELADSMDMPLGEIRNNPKSRNMAASPTPRKNHPTPEDDKNGRISPPELLWPRRTEFCVAGSAGQRIRSAVGVVGDIAVAAGLFAAQQDDFPITVRRGHSVSNLILSDSPINYTGVDNAELLLVLTEDGVRRIQDWDQFSPEAIVFADADLELPPTSARIERVDRKAVEKSAGKASGALALLAFAIVKGKWMDPETFRNIAASGARGKYRDQNLEAIRFGIDLANTGS